MESANLSRAHEHIRNAVTATQGNSIVTAGVEHELAAASFHHAVDDTNDAEVYPPLARPVFVPKFA